LRQHIQHLLAGAGNPSAVKSCLPVQLLSPSAKCFGGVSQPLGAFSGTMENGGDAKRCRDMCSIQEMQNALRTIPGYSQHPASAARTPAISCTHAITAQACPVLPHKRPDPGHYRFAKLISRRFLFGLGVFGSRPMENILPSESERSDGLGGFAMLRKENCKCVHYFGGKCITLFRPIQVIRKPDCSVNRNESSYQYFMLSSLATHLRTRDHSTMCSACKASISDVERCRAFSFAEIIAGPRNSSALSAPLIPTG